MPSEAARNPLPDSYLVVDAVAFRPGRLCLVLDASYDTFARRHEVGTCYVRISLPDGTAFTSPASMAIVDGNDPVSARPMVMLYEPLEKESLPAGSYCQILPGEANNA